MVPLTLVTRYFTGKLRCLQPLYDWTSGQVDGGWSCSGFHVMSVIITESPRPNRCSSINGSVSCQSSGSISEHTCVGGVQVSRAFQRIHDNHDTLLLIKVQTVEFVMLVWLHHIKILLILQQGTNQH